MNHQFVEQMGFGVSLKMRSELKAVLNNLLYNRLIRLKQTLEHFDKKSGVIQIQKLISGLLEPNESIGITSQYQLLEQGR